MLAKISCVSLVALGMFMSSIVFAGPVDDPIKAVKKVKVDEKVLKKSSATNPLLIKTEKGAKEFFDEKELKKLTEKVDFDKQKVLVFAWKGSGQDKIEYDVAESYPEQIQFKYKRGRSRDLRTHYKIFVLRANVKWSVK